MNLFPCFSFLKVHIQFLLRISSKKNIVMLRKAYLGYIVTTYMRKHLPSIEVIEFLLKKKTYK